MKYRQSVFYGHWAEFRLQEYLAVPGIVMSDRLEKYLDAHGMQ